MDVWDIEQQTPQHLAVCSGHNEAIQMLIGMEGEVDDLDRKHYAHASLGIWRSYSANEILIEKGATVDACAMSQKARLHLAASSGQAEAI